jgi:hypothetical protein
VVAWQVFWRPAPVTDTVPERSSATGGQPAPPQAVRALDKYRLAVLPFVNISQNPEEEYFADGMTEELISHLSKLRAASHCPDVGDAIQRDRQGHCRHRA